MRERDLIEWITRQAGFDPAVVEVGPGDDCAVLHCGDEQILVTTDQVIDKVHVDVARHGFAAAGRKAMARNLSDIAAMAAVPIAAVAAVALPAGCSDESARQLYAGLRQGGDPFNCPVVGGDVSASPGPLTVTVTVLGRPAGVELVLRSGGRPGDAICVTGRLGGAWRAGRDLTFTPRIAEARTLAQSCDLHAMIDLSDGLATDLGHICRASGCGAEVRADAVPIHPDAHAADRPALTAALADGEDYELLFTLPAEQAERLVAQQPLACGVTIIGKLTPGEVIELISPDGRREPLAGGWEHVT